MPYKLVREIKLKVDKEKVWDFFSNPYNLDFLTPPEMKFKIETENLSTKIYNNLVIDYTLTPLLGIKLNWTTKIDDVVEWKEFTDMQMNGPYKLWVHRHTFKEVAGEIIMRDEVNYELPYGLIGHLAHWLFLKRKLNAIFNYRTKVIQQIFSTHD